MTRTTDLNNLAESCEKATGPDRELDVAIAKALGLEHGKASGWANDENGDYWVIDECAAPFTASLDAAMTLIPEDECFELSSYDIYARVGSPGKFFGAGGATPALALVAAALKSRAGQEEGR